ncbi:MAG: type II toxin-antitoxin system RelE/ParE family toxin [Bacteroidetes bacterium]|nr:type II toxin-antitoxin system RelE/ParE family toxin [Bacteroidota bacterium]
MAKYELSKKAKSDVEDIADYTIENWGIKQSKEYLVGLYECFEILLDNQSIGRDASEFSSGLHKFTFKSHIIFYQSEGNDILIVRILHHSRDYLSHLP